MIKRLVRWAMKDEIEAVRNGYIDAINGHREWISSSLAISFRTVHDRVDAVETLALETSGAVERLSEEHNLLAGAHEHLDDIVTGLADEQTEDQMFLGAAFEDILDRLDELEN